MPAPPTIPSARVAAHGRARAGSYGAGMTTSTAQGPQVGDPAPAVDLLGPDGPVPLRSLHQERTLVLYFYPQDDTIGCTIEACTFRDAYEDFVEAGAEVVGVSADRADSHRRFAAKHRLPFRLLSDPTGEARLAYGVRKALGLFEGRVTFVIDRGGVVRPRFASRIDMKGHVAEALAVVRRLAVQPPPDVSRGPRA